MGRTRHQRTHQDVAFPAPGAFGTGMAVGANLGGNGPRGINEVAQATPLLFIPPEIPVADSLHRLTPTIS